MVGFVRSSISSAFLSFDTLFLKRFFAIALSSVTLREDKDEKLGGLVSLRGFKESSSILLVSLFGLGGPEGPAGELEERLELEGLDFGDNASIASDKPEMLEKSLLLDLVELADGEGG